MIMCHTCSTVQYFAVEGLSATLSFTRLTGETVQTEAVGVALVTNHHHSSAREFSTSACYPDVGASARRAISRVSPH